MDRIRSNIILELNFESAEHAGLLIIPQNSQGLSLG